MLCCLPQIIVAFAFALVPRPLRGQVKGAVMEGPCSVERRLLTGNLKWLHWLVVIRHLILPVGLLTSFKVPSRIGGISAPPQGTLQQSTRLSRGLGGLGRFPEKAVSLSLVGLPWTIAKIKILGWGGAGVPSIQWPVADRPTAAPSPPSGQ